MALRNKLLIYLSLIIAVFGILICFVGLFLFHPTKATLALIGFAIFALGVYMFFWLWEKRDRKQNGKEKMGRGYLTPW